MSNDATDRPVRIVDERTFDRPWQEPLALKLIYDEFEEAEAKQAFRRNVLLYYFACTQFVAMRGQGCRFSQDDLLRWSCTDKDTHTQCRQFLEDLRLIRVDERMEPGGRRKTLFVTVLNAPHSVSQNGISSEPNPEQPAASFPQANQSQNPTYRSVEGEKTPDSLRESVAAANVESDETSATSTGGVDLRQQPSSARVSLRGWSREQIRAHHAASPDAPPAGTQPMQALLCALATTEGSGIVFDDKDAFERACSRVRGLLSRPYRGRFHLSYKDWMDGALSFDGVPMPKDKPFTFEYWIGAIASTALRALSQKWESDHLKQKTEPSVAGGERLTDADLARMVEQIIEEGGMKVEVVDIAT